MESNETMLAYFDARYTVHLRVLNARRSVTQVQAELGAARMAGRDFERKFEITVQAMIESTGQKM